MCAWCRCVCVCVRVANRRVRALSKFPIPNRFDPIKNKCSEWLASTVAFRPTHLDRHTLIRRGTFNVYYPCVTHHVGLDRDPHYGPSTFQKTTLDNVRRHLLCRLRFERRQRLTGVHHH